MKSLIRLILMGRRVSFILLVSTGISFGQGFPSSDEVSNIAVYVRTTDGTQLPGFPFVELFRYDRRIEYGYCDNRGEYTFYNLEEDQYRVRVSLSGFEPNVQDVPLQGGVVQNIFVDLRKSDRLGPSPFAVEELTKARQLRAKGDWEGAIQHLKRAVEDSPRFAVARVELGIYYWQTDQLNEAQENFESAIEIAPNLLPAYLNLAEVFARKGDVEKVRDVCSRASEAHPDRGEPYYVLSRALLEAGRFEESEEAAKLALEHDHSRIPKLHLLLAGFHQKNGDSEKELASLQAFITQDPSSPQLDLVRERIRVIQEEQQIEAGTRLYLDVVDRYRKGDFSVASRELSQIPREAVLKAGERLMKGAAKDDTLTLSAILLHTEVALLPGDDSSFHISRAAVLMNGFIDDARRKEIERRWCLTMGYHFQGKAGFLSALPFFTEAAEQNTGDLEVALGYGSVCEAASVLHGFHQLLDEAEAQYRLILMNRPDHVEANMRLGHVLMRRERWDEAAVHLKRALAHAERPDPILVSNLLLGDIHRTKGELETAIHFYQSALEMDPRCQAAAVALSHALHRARYLTESTEVLKRLMNVTATRATDDSWWRYLKGRSNQFESMMEELRSEVLR